MNCAECIKGFELIELPFGSSIDAIKSARKTWHKNLHPDVWQEKPGWKGAQKQLTNVNLAIDHLLACDGATAPVQPKVDEWAQEEEASPEFLQNEAEEKAINDASDVKFLRKEHTKGWVCATIAFAIVLFAVWLFPLLYQCGAVGWVLMGIVTFIAVIPAGATVGFFSA